MKDMKFIIHNIKDIQVSKVSKSPAYREIKIVSFDEGTLILQLYGKRRDLRIQRKDKKFLDL